MYKKVGARIKPKPCRMFNQIKYTLGPN